MCNWQSQWESPYTTVGVYYYSRRIINDPSVEMVESTINKNIVRFLIVPNPQSSVERVITFELPDENNVFLSELLDLAQIKLNGLSKVSHVSDHVMNVDYIIENCCILLKPWEYQDDDTETLDYSYEFLDSSATTSDDEKWDDDESDPPLTIDEVEEVDDIEMS